MELSHKSEYAILALLALAASYPTGESLQIRQIAEIQNIPVRYLEQLLAVLRRGGLIKSIRGAKGGYILSRDPRTTTLWDAFNCIEGLEGVFPDYKASSKTVDSSIILEVWQEVQGAAVLVLQKYTLQDLCDRRQFFQQTLTMYHI
ncbi:MAG: Rrf2 family transcriptional regulator [Scytonematopsis contorta HA4267-MV1]|jgi:Rrf2 family protein|nr:Rrf2 family transcriptional regulator [Scytonematopsis contorta HA4267-MV1]